MAAVLLNAFVFAACEDDQNEETYAGLSIKSYMPTTVMEGTEITIAGSALDEVTALSFPGDIEVKNFELVTTNMIRVVAPAGIAAEGGPLKLVAGDRIVESHVAMKLAKPVVKSLDPGDEVQAGGELSFKGEDLECIKQALFPTEDGGNISIESMDFLRKSSDNIKVIVPEEVKSGICSFTLIAANGAVLNTPEVNVLVAPKDPLGTVVGSICNASSGRYITRNDLPTPMIMNRTGGNNQKFKFMPIPDMAFTYYIWSFETGEYLAVGEENNWRMAWVADPTAIPNPDNARFQIVPVDDNSEYVKIRVLGSKCLGTDSDDDNSEVYSDKSGEEPRYQWRIDILSGSFDEGWNQVWEGESEYDEWGWLDQFVPVSGFVGLKVGQSIRMYFTPVEGQEPQIDLRDGNDRPPYSDERYNWKSMKDFDTYELGYIDIPVDEDLYDRIFNAGEGGFHFRGYWYVLTKVELVN